MIFSELDLSYFRNQLLNSHVDVGSNLVGTIATVFQQCVQLLSANPVQPRKNDDVAISNELIFECSRLLRNSCAIGQSVQNQIAQFVSESCSIFDSINLVLVSKHNLSMKTRKMCWQFVANLGVQNEQTQHHIWTKSIEPILGQLNCVCETGNSRECTMILYNLCISEILSTVDMKKVAEVLLQCMVDQNGSHELQTNDFHQLFMEYIITKYRSIVPVYDRMVPFEKRLHLIFYIADHMKTIRHDPISTILLQFVCKEFKKKSDCILRAISSSADAIHPKEVVALLDIIAQASSDERYSHILATDNSLFINIGCLLRSIHEIGKSHAVNSVEEKANIFSPVQKLNQLAPNSNDDSSIERDISYQLKSMLIRILANLVYKNKEHQDLVSKMFIVLHLCIML